jgi:phosphomethylpyrimidine synthase
MNGPCFSDHRPVRRSPVRKYAADQGITEEDALKRRVEEKSREFQEKGAELCAKA